MINGFDVGTEVKWNEDNTLQVGVVKRVFHQPEDVQINGVTVHVEVREESPTYLIFDDDQQYILMPHDELMLKSTNLHT